VRTKVADMRIEFQKDENGRAPDEYTGDPASGDVVFPDGHQVGNPNEEKPWITIRRQNSCSRRSCCSSG
jgi:hypothetical protein